MTTNTDIKELAKKLREVAQSEINIQTILGPVDKFFDKFSPEELLSVLDALEAAQKNSARWFNAFHKAVSVGARYEERIAELEASQPVVPDELLKIGELIRTQDNRVTEQPLFAVMQKREYVGHEDYSAGGHDRIVWVDEYGGEADERTSRRLESLNRACRDTRGWERLKMFEVDEFVTACFTEQGCKDHIAINGHNLNKPFVYAFGSFRNAEYRAIRDWLIAAPAPQEGNNA